MIWHKVSSGELPELTNTRFDACGYTVRQSDLLLLKVNHNDKLLTLTGHYCGQDGWLLNGYDGDAWIVREGVSEWAAIEDETHVVSANAKPEERRGCPFEADGFDCNVRFMAVEDIDFVQRWAAEHKEVSE